ncbi:MAG: DNA polymerase III subunit gamma/tau, partial [Dongiaceae bacterium]
FIFATTEIRKVPVTVLSRCQRFDLRRVEARLLIEHLARVAEQEQVGAEAEALRMIARAAEGSVRDALSLLDQAIALAEGEIGEAQVRDMLGLADRAQLFDLFDLLMRGQAGAALDLAAEMYAAGADPAALLQDLLELTHWLTRVKVAPQAGEGPTVPETERVRGRAMAERLSLGVLTRTWQLLLKGLGEVQAASMPLPAAEMVLIRLIHAAEMPTPAELIARLAGAGDGAPGAGQPTPTVEARGPSAAAAPEAGPDRPRAAHAGGGAVTAPQSQPQPQPAAPQPQSFAEVVALCGERREAIMQAHLRNNLHLVQFEPGRIEIRPGEHAPANLANRLGAALSQWTGRRWIVAVSGAAGEPTLGEQAAAAARAERAEIAAHPLVQAVLSSFPGATIEAVRGLEPAAAPDIDPGEGGDGA